MFSQRFMTCKRMVCIVLLIICMPSSFKTVDDKTETTLLVHFFGKKGKAELKFEDFYKWVFSRVAKKDAPHWNTVQSFVFCLVSPDSWTTCRLRCLRSSSCPTPRACPPSARKTLLGFSFVTQMWTTSADIWRMCGAACQRKWYDELNKIENIGLRCF